MDFVADVVGRRVVALGIDLVEIDRMRRLVARQPGFVARVFTDREQEYANRAADPAERFAARFAAKEAVLKALGVGLGGANFRDIEVDRLASGAPTLAVTGKGAVLAAELGIASWLITLTHSDLTAGAVVAGLATDSDTLVRWTCIAPPSLLSRQHSTCSPSCFTSCPSTPYWLAPTLASSWPVSRDFVT
ncbi:MAG: holo-ACP synthase [Acidimicrobiales bacterium]